MDLGQFDLKEVTFAVLFLATFVYLMNNAKKDKEKETEREEKYLMEAAKREEKYQEIIGNLTDKIETITTNFSAKLELIAAELRQIKEIVCDDSTKKL